MSQLNKREMVISVILNKFRIKIYHDSHQLFHQIKYLVMSFYISCNKVKRLPQRCTRLPLTRCILLAEWTGWDRSSSGCLPTLYPRNQFSSSLIRHCFPSAAPFLIGSYAAPSAIHVQHWQPWKAIDLLHFTTHLICIFHWQEDGVTSSALILLIWDILTMAGSQHLLYAASAC